MSMFEPYHAGIINTLNNLDPDDDNYLVLLRAFANFAQIIKVPREYRLLVGDAFARRAMRLGTSGRNDVGDVIRACEDVKSAMHQQNLEDAEGKAKMQRQD